MRNRFVSLDLRFAFDSFRRDLERPRKNQRDWKACDQNQHDQTHRPIWNVEKGKNLRRDLNQQPRRDRIRDRDFVNVAPFQLGEEIVDLHSDYWFGPISSLPVSNCWKPGSLRIGSHTGSIFKRAMETDSPAGIDSNLRRIDTASA